MTIQTTSQPKMIALVPATFTGCTAPRFFIHQDAKNYIGSEVVGGHTDGERKHVQRMMHEGP